eukprot:512608-Hanusia_phi.AAC.1
MRRQTAVYSLSSSVPGGRRSGGRRAAGPGCRSSWRVPAIGESRRAAGSHYGVTVGRVRVTLRLRLLSRLAHA